MTQVDFYILHGSGELARRQFACRLAEKAYRLEHVVHIRTPDPESTAQLDDLLWTYRDGSFVPHEVVTNETAPAESPVTVGAVAPASRSTGLLINLCNALPDDSAAFPRIAEIVTSDEEIRRLSRERYARYRELGHTLETHKL